MAFIQINMMSETLLRTVNINAIIPIEVNQTQKSANLTSSEKAGKLPTLYLLHGVFGSQYDWPNMTVIQKWAEENNIAVIMPAGDNKFYIDYPETHDYYGQFIGEELVDITRSLFPLSHDKKNTFIGGLSMGGYGALRNGLKYHGTFGAIAGLSVADFVDMEIERTEPINDKFLKAVFGDLEKAKCSDKSIYYLLEKNAKQDCNDQKIYIACGEEDILLKESEKMYRFFERFEYDVTFEHGVGGHEWNFWNTYIKQVIEWLPLTK